MKPDITIGTHVKIHTSPGLVGRIIEHGFETVQLTAWRHVGKVNLAEQARALRDQLDGRARISALALFGNPVEDPVSKADLIRLIDTAPDFGCDLLVAFTGALDGLPVPESIGPVVKTWTELLERAGDNGVRIAFENCDMGSTWRHAHYNIAFAPKAWPILVEALGAPANLGICWDPSHLWTTGVDPLPHLRTYREFVLNIHGKDAMLAPEIQAKSGFAGGETWCWHRFPGYGSTDWRQVVAILREHGYRGSIDIEGRHDPFLEGELEMSGQVSALRHLIECRGGPFVEEPLRAETNLPG